MKEKIFKRTVSIPTLKEFGKRFPHYGPRAAAEGRPLFDLVMKATTFIDADALTRVLGVPAVAAVSTTAGETVARELTGTDRQFLGALICTLMEANGYAKTGRKRAIPHKAWNRGEVYTVEP